MRLFLCSCSSSPDYIVVRDGLDNSAPVIGRFCNDLTQIRVTSTGENLSVEFVSDSKKQLQGFSGSFSFSNPEQSLLDAATILQTIATVYPPGKGNPDGKHRVPSSCLQQSSAIVALG